VQKQSVLIVQKRKSMIKEHAIYAF